MARAGKLIGLEESLRNGLIEKWGYVDYTIPAGTYKGQDKPIDTVGLPMVFFAREDVSDEVVYLITKTVAEMKDRLVKVNAAFQRWEPEMMPKGLGIDIHPGAVKYYKERGWP